MIEFDFGKALAQANELEEIADEMKSLSNSNMDSTLQLIAANWKGDSATAFLRKGDLLKQDIAKTSETLRSIASSIRVTAQRLFEAEQAAKELANKMASTQ